MAAPLSISDAVRSSPFLLGQITDWPAELYPDGAAIVDEAGTITYRGLRAGIDAASARLAAAGAQSGQRWAVREPALRSFVPSVMALLRMGCLVSPIPASFSTDRILDVDQQLGLTGLLLADDDPAASGLPASRPDLAVRTELTGPTLLMRGMPRRGRQDWTVLGGPVDLEPAIVLWTSGSTGAPRGVVLQHHAVLANMQSNIRALKLQDDDRTLVLLPLAHAYGLIHQCFCHLMIGGTLVGVTGPMIGPQLMRVIEAQSVTTLAVAPPMLRVLVDGARRTGHRCPSLRLVTIGAARAETRTVDEFRCAFPHVQIAVTYGLTEAGPRVTTHMLGEGPFDPSCVGEPNPNVQVRVSRRAAGRGAVGVRSRSRMLGYVCPDSAAGAGGALATGDLGAASDGRLHLHGRSDRLINRGGFMVAPEAIEAALREHPSVLSARVDGRPDAALGEVPVAWVVMATGAPGAEIAALTSWCEQRLASHEQPAEIRAVSELSDVTMEKVGALSRMVVEPH